VPNSLVVALFLTLTIPASLNWTAAEDHQNMLDQLGIKALRPGPSGQETAPNHANYDESPANPYPNLPDVLKLNNGKPVTSASQWWKQRRPEIVEDFEREVVGRVPANVPQVTWTITSTTSLTIGSTMWIKGLLASNQRKAENHASDSTFVIITFWRGQALLVIDNNSSHVSGEAFDFFLCLELHRGNQSDGVRQRF